MTLEEILDDMLDESGTCTVEFGRTSKGLFIMDYRERGPNYIHFSWRASDLKGLVEAVKQYPEGME